jgi:transposase
MACRSGADGRESGQAAGPGEFEARERMACLVREAGLDVCPRCRGARVYRLGSGRRRCGGCGYTFRLLTGRFLGLAGISHAEWLEIIELFASETPVKDAAARMDMAYNTVYKAMDALRQAILAQAIDAAQIRQALASRGLRAWPPVFGVMQSGGWVFVDLVADVEASDLTLFKMHFRLKTSRVGSVVCTGPMRGYQGLVCCGGPAWLTPALKARDAGLSLDEAEGFWPFLKARLARLQGVSSDKFPLYLKELEFRWNHREEDLEALLLKLGLSFMPQDGGQCREP